MNIRNAGLIALLLLPECSARAPEQIVEPELYDYDVEARIAELGIELTPSPMPPGIKIVRAVTVGEPRV